MGESVKWCFIIVALLSACGLETDKTPVGATRAFLHAAQRGNCKRAWALLSVDRQAALTQEFGKLKARGRAASVDELYCGTSSHNSFGGMDASTTNARSEEATAATTDVDGKDGTLWSIDLRREGAGWRVHRQYPR